MHLLTVVTVAALVALAGTGCTDLWPPARTATATPAGEATVAPPPATHTPDPAPTRTAPPTATLPPSPVPTVTRTPTVTLAPPAAVVRVDPRSQSAGLNGTVGVSILADRVTNLYGLDLHLTFDPARLEAQDADGNADNGVQVAPGDWMDASRGLMVRNVVDNAAGQVQYVFTLAAPAPPVSGTGALVRITFRTRAAGNAWIRLDGVMLANNQAAMIPVTTEDGSITVGTE